MVFETRETLDTNVILRIMFGDVPEQAEKARALLRRKGFEYEVPDLAVTEAVYVMETLGLRRGEVVADLCGFFKYMNIKVNLKLFEKVFPMYLEHPKLSFNDCYLAVYAELNEVEPLWTFDRVLAKQSGTAKLVA